MTASAYPDGTPLRYVNKNFAHATLTGCYRQARIGLVTSLRDGMSRVAKEFVAAQDGADPGALALSILAGAADEMKEALIVNPHELEGVADAIATASSMPLSERMERWRALMDQLQQNDIRARAGVICNRRKRRRNGLNHSLLFVIPATSNHSKRRHWILAFAVIRVTFRTALNQPDQLHSQPECGSNRMHFAHVTRPFRRKNFIRAQA